MSDDEIFLAIRSIEPFFVVAYSVTKNDYYVDGAKYNALSAFRGKQPEDVLRLVWKELTQPKGAFFTGSVVWNGESFSPREQQKPIETWDDNLQVFQ